MPCAAVPLAHHGCRPTRLLQFGGQEGHAKVSTRGRQGVVARVVLVDVYLVCPTQKLGSVSRLRNIMVYILF